MYLIINHFAFEYPKNDISDTDIVSAFNNLGELFIELKKLNVDLITHSTLSQISLNKKPIRDYIQNLENTNIKRAMISLLGKIRPLCSDTDLSFEGNENIAFGNCKEEIESLDVCYTFLSCALFYLDPILTINNLCSKEQFLEDKIKIICDEDKYTLSNYKLIPYQNVLDKISQYQKDNLIVEYNSINDWEKYQEFINVNFSFCKITNHCIEELKSRYSYGNSYSRDFRNKVERINKFIVKEGGKPLAADFKKLSKKHYSPESKTRKNDLKKSHPTILNFSNLQVDLDWHTWVQDCRMYFERENDHVCFVHYEKKIT